MNRISGYRSQSVSLRLVASSSSSFEDSDSKMLKDVLSFGSMCGTSLASPVLFELRKTWFCNILVFIISASVFILGHVQEIKTYWPLTLAIVGMFGLAAYSSSRISWQELMPWLPLTICLFVLLTVYFFPKLKRSLRGDNYRSIALEEGRSRGFYGSPVEPGSIQSDETVRSHQWNPEVSHWLGHETAHSGEFDHMALSEGGSDIDLDDGPTVPRIFSQSLAGSSDRNYHGCHQPQGLFTIPTPIIGSPSSTDSGCLNLPGQNPQSSLHPKPLTTTETSFLVTDPTQPLLG